MCPDREPLPFAEAAQAAARAEDKSAQGGEGDLRGLDRTGVRRTILIAAISAWLLLIAVYALIFALSGIPIARAIRGALANGVPDGLLAIAAVTTGRRLSSPRAGAGRLVLAHLPRALVLVGMAGAMKSIFLWIDVKVMGSGEPFRLVAAVVAWQAFVSILIYATFAAAAQVWLTDRKLREEEARATRAEALQARAQLSALRAQMNPHFLFNVLHSILGLVRGDPALAEAALEDLGDLLRYALRVHRDGADWTALRREWEFMETYLDLEKIRLQDRLRLALRVEESALDFSVPTFSLQPLVENAVRHGIAPRAEGGVVSIEARIEGEALRLEVSNDGHSGQPVSSGEGGMGLRLLRDRLRVLYQDEARMTAGPTKEGGYRVVLWLPAMPQGQEADG